MVGLAHSLRPIKHGKSAFSRSKRDAFYAGTSALFRAGCFSLFFSHTTLFYTTLSHNTMSSPTQRRSTRGSANNTPRRSQRSSQVPRSSEPPASDPPLPDADASPNSQLLSEANGASPRNTTPRGTQNSNSQSQAPPTSSPLFFRSSPAGSQSQSQSQSLGVPARGSVNGSSPLRQRADANTPAGLSSDGGRTPRANGGIGGKLPRGDFSGRAMLIVIARLLANTLCDKFRCCRSSIEWPASPTWNELFWAVRSLRLGKSAKCKR